MFLHLSSEIVEGPESKETYLHRAVHSGGGEAGGTVAPTRKTKCFCIFSNIVFDFAGLFLVAMLVRNVYTGDPCEGVRSLPANKKS